MSISFNTSWFQFEYRNCSLIQMIREVMAKNPSKSFNEVKKLCMGTKRYRVSRHQPHYGEQAAARNRVHMFNHTHGL